MTPKVLWITGLPGSGKTTTAKLICEQLKHNGKQVILLDGDEMRRVFGVAGGYSIEERKQLSYQYSRLAKMISDQGHNVIVSTVSLFHEIHDWNRKNINNYIEIYLDVDMETLKKRDQGQLYSSAQNGTLDKVVGINIAAETPQNPDIRITNDTQLDATSIAKMIIKSCNL
ncbi:adenylyl-sulfate kinase [Paraglaciecola aquimarina]|uniref:Adenylyl-sulfate kinase n=1 Tax=Paraglaciecola algarum TaxID=3050085 RepID=A0ABS9D7W3_9ALTE|nr:adenylyl-sulfate kinase [Paraglaciecola sp. G1-23]MCF2948113.1 adenylyl-sulfate kinase [Paraglaciecola sp. G1-23]